MPCASVPLQLPSPPCPRLSSPIVTPASVSLTNTSASSSAPSPATSSNGLLASTASLAAAAQPMRLQSSSQCSILYLPKPRHHSHPPIRLRRLSILPILFPLASHLHALALKLSFSPPTKHLPPRHLTDRMPERNLVSDSDHRWLRQNGLADEALELFGKMQDEGVDPDYVAAISAASACADLGRAGPRRMWLHHFAFKRGMIANVRFCNSLIDMYSRCGRVDFARRVFDEMSIKHWRARCLQPCRVGRRWAQVVPIHANRWGIKTSIEHYGCLVDFGRAGLLERAELGESMPMKPNEVVLGSLLSAAVCTEMSVWRNDWMAVLVRVRGLMRSKGVKRRPGFSSVEVGCSVHHFMAGDGSHPMADQIHALLALLHVDMELHGYKPSEGAAGESD
ncbi:hypothetical protein HPP92_010963 [Vanilla planifolia]|uniref:Pentatricopeptide repeat-containing protein n=1 Tax=Vanilla planifolia TaxID=51239 RepID=A0A835R651_VANPL|nr:hypothetical protein HPP92_010963 [Vanilla planifolia]